MSCVAVPVFEKGGNVPGGIAISGPISRFDIKHLEWLRDVALDHATKLSRTRGGLG
jgi:DNA-binding IclR family transcriptional regulator